jgi:probable rRNA maturation factor
MIEVVNRQRKHKLDLERWQEFVARALALLSAERDGVTVAFVSDRSMRELNRMWRHTSSTTDVLSFPSAPADVPNEESTMGDVVISVDRAREQARDNGLTLENEIQQLILHGLLHLCGYDHEIDNGEMNRLELKLRHRLRI